VLKRQVALEKMQLLYEGEGLDKSIIDSYKGIRSTCSFWSDQLVIFEQASKSEYSKLFSSLDSNSPRL